MINLLLENLGSSAAEIHHAVPSFSFTTMHNLTPLRTKPKRIHVFCWKLLDPPLYSKDLPPSDCYLILHLKQLKLGSIFQNEELKTGDTSLFIYCLSVPKRHISQLSLFRSFLIFHFLRSGLLRTVIEG